MLPVDATTAALARHDPDQVFLLELLCSGILGLPGIGHLVIGDVGIGVAVLIGYPLGFWTVYTIVTIFTCGIGAFLILFMWPANFLIGFLLANRAKQRVLDARRAMGMLR